MLEKLKKDNLVYYIYQRGSSIYGLNNKNSDIDYFVIVDDKYKNENIIFNPNYPNQLGNIKIDNEDFTFISISEWFKKIENSDIDAWECACLPKKFIHKEHVKLLLSTDPLKIRTQIDELMLNVDSNQNYCEIIRKCKFAIQIIENHKIVNFKEANSECIVLKNIDDLSEKHLMFRQLIKTPISILKKLTDGIVEKSKLKRLVQKAT